MIVKSWNFFYKYLHKLFIIMQNQWFIMHWLANNNRHLATSFKKSADFRSTTVVDYCWQSTAVADSVLISYGFA